MAETEQKTATEEKVRFFVSHPAWGAFLIGLAVFMMTCAVWQYGLLQSSELWLYDHFIKLRADKLQVDKQPPDPRIVLVLADEKDVEALDYPLRDKLLSDVLEKIETGGPRVIGLDLYRDLPEPRDGSESGFLATTLQQHRNIFGIYLMDMAGAVSDQPKTATDNPKPADAQDQPIAIPPPPAIPRRSLFNNFPFDYKTVRRADLFQHGNKYLSLAWVLAQYYLVADGIRPEKAEPNSEDMRFGKSILRQLHGNDGGYIDSKPPAGYQIFLDFRGPQTFNTYSIRKVLKMPDASLFKDKIVLIGAGAESMNDRVTTPLGDGVSGTAVHAQIINQLLRAALDGDQPLTSVAVSSKWFFAAIWCIAGIVCGYLTRSHTSFAFCTLLGVISIYYLGWDIFLAGYWMPIVAPLISFVLSAMLVKAYAANLEERQRSLLMKIFSQHVSKNVANKLWQQRDIFTDGGRPVPLRLTATILFTDLKDFSTISERMNEADLMSWLNEYFTGMAQQVEKNDGIINKYIGDAVMAVFGVPEKRMTEEEIREDAIRAVSCALAMAKEMDVMNKRWASQKGKPQAAMRVGINTGELMAGGLGSSDRLEYTVIGDCVNTASRLEGYDKEEKLTGPHSACRILIGGATYKYVEDVFVLQPVGSTELKGQKRTTEVYKVIDFKNNGSNLRDI